MSVEINESAVPRGDGSLNGRVQIDPVTDQLNVYDNEDKRVSSQGDLGEGDYGFRLFFVPVTVSVVTVPAGIVLSLVTTITQLDGIPITADWDTTFFKDAVASGNEYEIGGFGSPGSGVWAGIDKSDVNVEFFNSWGLTDNINIKHVSIFKNDTAGSIDIIFKGQARIFMSGGA